MEMAEVTTAMVVVWVVNLSRPREVTCGSAISQSVRCSAAQFHPYDDYVVYICHVPSPKFCSLELWGTKAISGSIY